MTDWNDVKGVASDRDQILAVLWIMYPVLIGAFGFVAMLWIAIR